MVATIVSVIGYVIGCGLIALMCYWVVQNELEQHAAVDAVDARTAVWPTGRAVEELAKARAYNTALATGRTAAASGGLMTGNGGPGPRSDKDYMGALDVDSGSGVMATISIPSISSKLLIYHTTDDDALMSGVGHLYGTALPIGDPGTMSALAAHSGEPDRLYFTRLHELGIGDYFYINVLGKEMGYRIDHIDVVDPDDVAALHKYDAVTRDKARVTLITCTPIGINTQRLLVSGVREEIPKPGTQRDTRLEAFIIALVVLLALLVVGVVGTIARRMMRHSRARSRGRHSADARIGPAAGSDGQIWPPAPGRA